MSDPFVHKPMSDRLTRRNFLAAVGTAAVSRGMLSRLAFAADEPAQTPHSTLGTNSTLDYGSTRELVAMLANRKIQAWYPKLWQKAEINPSQASLLAP